MAVEPWQSVVTHLDLDDEDAAARALVSRNSLTSGWYWYWNSPIAVGPDLHLYGTPAQGTAAYYLKVEPIKLPHGGTAFTLEAQSNDSTYSRTDWSISGHQFNVRLVSRVVPATAVAYLVSQTGDRVRAATLAIEPLYPQWRDDGVQAMRPSNPRPYAASLTGSIDLRGLGTGTYGLEVVMDANKWSYAEAVRVWQAGEPPPEFQKLVYLITVPRAARSGRPIKVGVWYQNPDTNVSRARLVRISVGGGAITRIGQGPVFEYAEMRPVSPGVRSFLGLAISATRDAGVLRSRNQDAFALEIMPDGSADSVTVQIHEGRDGDPVDWSALAAEMKPAFVPEDAWRAVCTNFCGLVGGTVGDLNGALSRMASCLSDGGEYVYDVNVLLSRFVRLAGLVPLTQRYDLGAFGRGRRADWELSVAIDEVGNAVVSKGALPQRLFTPNGDGTFSGTLGDSATLEATADGYVIREPGGVLVAFDEQGKLVSSEDRNGNRTVFQYEAGRMTEIQYPNGDVVTVDYNEHGRVSEIVDVVGRRTQYAYDASGEHLLQTANAQGTQTFSYVTGQGAAREHALSSVQYPDGHTLHMEYDDQGRLTHRYWNRSRAHLLRLWSVRTVTVQFCRRVSVTDYGSRTGH